MGVMQVVCVWGPERIEVDGDRLRETNDSVEPAENSECRRISAMKVIANGG